MESESKIEVAMGLQDPEVDQDSGSVKRNKSRSGVDWEPILFECEQPKRKRRCSETHASWISKESCKSQNSALQVCTEEFNQVESSLFILEQPSKLLEYVCDNCNNQSLHNHELNTNAENSSSFQDSLDPDEIIYSDRPSVQRELTTTKPENGCGSLTACESSQIASSEKSTAETSKVVQALVRSMTFGQKKKFYAWFCSGLSIEAAAVKSKIPGLEAPPVRHPNCKLSKKRLKRLAYILPNVFLQRQFVYKTYFSGSNPKDLMAQLLSNLGMEELMSPFEDQIALEEFATQEKRLRRTRRGETTVDAPVTPKVTLNKTVERVHVSLQRDLDAGLEDGEIDPRKPCLNKTSVTDPIIRVVSAQETVSNDEEAELQKLALNQRKKYYKWRNLGFSHSEALGKAFIPGLVPEFHLPHPDCKYSLVEVKKMSNAILNTHQKPKFLTEVYYGGKKPEGAMKSIVDGGSFLKSDHSSAQDCDRAFDPSIPSQGKFADKESTQLSNISLNQLKKYYRWRNKGLSSSEAFEKAKIPNLVPENDDPHPNCGRSWNELKVLSSALPTKSAQNRFRIETFYGGKDPHKLLKHLSTDVNQASELSPKTTKSVSDDDNTLATMAPLHNVFGLGIRSIECGDVVPLSSDLSPSSSEILIGGVESIIPRESGTIPSNTIPSSNENGIVNENLDPQMGYLLFGWKIHTASEIQDDSVLKLSNRPLKQYFAWRNEGFSHSNALSKTIKKLHKTGGELQRFYAPHSNCKLSREELKRLSHELPEKFLRDRFLIFTCYGGMEPSDAMSLVRSTALPDVLLAEEKLPGREKKVRRKMRIDYLLGKGLTREEALSKMRNPSEQLMKELEEVVEASCCEKRATIFSQHIYQNRIQSGPETTPIPLSSSYHPLTNSTCVSLGSNSGQEVPQDRSAFPEFPDEVLNVESFAPTVGAVPVANDLTFPDPDAKLQFLANLGQLCPSAKPVAPSSMVCMPLQEFAGPPVEVSAVAPVPISNGLSDDVAPFQLKFLPNLGQPKISPESDVTASSGVASPGGENHTSEDNELQCFIVPVDYPNKCLTEPQMDAIEDNILEAIIEMDNDDPRPSFKGSFRSNGQYGFVCSDEFSAGWLCKYLTIYEPWEGAALRLVKNWSSKVKANAVLPLCKGDDDKKILKFIEKQNDGLNVSQWTVVTRCNSNDGNTLMDLIVDEESADVLRKCSRISFKMGTAEILIGKKDCSRSYDQRGSEYLTDSLQKFPAPASYPPLPSSLPPLTPPPPPLPPPLIPPPQSPQIKALFETSRGALLDNTAKTSTSTASPDRTCRSRPFRKVLPCSRGRKRYRSSSRDSLVPVKHGKIHSRKGRLHSKEHERSRSSSQDSTVPVKRGKIHSRKDRSHLKEHERSRSSFHESILPGKCGKIHSRKDRLYSKEHERSKSSSEDRIVPVKHGKIYSRKDRSHSKEHSRSRSSSQDSIVPVKRGKIHAKKDQSHLKEHERSRSSSQDSLVPVKHGKIHSRKDSLRSKEHERSRSSSQDSLVPVKHGKVHSRKDRLHSKEHECSRSSSLDSQVISKRGEIHSRKDRSHSRKHKRSHLNREDSFGRSKHGKKHKRKRSDKKDRKRSGSGSASKDRKHKHTEKKMRKKHRKRLALRSSLLRLENYCRELDWLYQGDKKREVIPSDPERAPPRSTTPCISVSSEENLSHAIRSTSPYSFVSSEENFSPSTSTPPPSRKMRDGSIENTECL